MAFSKNTLLNHFDIVSFLLSCFLWRANAQFFFFFSRCICIQRIFQFCELKMINFFFCVWVWKQNSKFHGWIIRIKFLIDTKENVCWGNFVRRCNITIWLFVFQPNKAYIISMEYYYHHYNSYLSVFICAIIWLLQLCSIYSLLLLLSDDTQFQFPNIFSSTNRIFGVSITVASKKPHFSQRRSFLLRVKLVFAFHIIVFRQLQLTIWMHFCFFFVEYKWFAPRIKQNDNDASTELMENQKIMMHNCAKQLRAVTKFFSLLISLKKKTNQICKQKWKIEKWFIIANCMTELLRVHSKSGFHLVCPIK